MKRNITVNLFGTLYPIDEDAYSLLDSYLTNMRGYFSRQPDGREIAEDIEARVGELMSELRASGVSAITIEHVEEIIRRVGNPEQLDASFDEQQEGHDSANTGTDPSDTIPPFPTEEPRRRLFRDTRHSLLGGVLAGLSLYWGINLTGMRIALFLLTICLLPCPDGPLFLIPVALYLVGWLLIPAAKTPAERLEMKGEPVNMATLREEFLDATREARAAGNTGAAGNMARTILSILKAAVGLGITALILFCAAGLIITIGVIIMMASVPHEDIGIIFENRHVLYGISQAASTLQKWGLSISLLLTFGITLFLSLYALRRIAGKTHPMGNGWLFGCVAVWLISLGALTGIWASTITTIVNYEQVLRHQRRMEKSAQSLEPLKEAGWTVSKERNLNGHYSKTGEHFEGYDQRRYIDGWQPDGDFSYEVIRTVKTAPGKYTLTAAARTDGNGCEIFAVNGKGERYASPVPNCGNVGGEIWNDARLKLQADTLGLLPDSERTSRIAQANHGRGYGWNTVTVKGITVGSDSILTYGVTNMSPVTPWDGIWFSATAFDLKRD